MEVRMRAMGHHTGASKCGKFNFNLQQVFEIVTKFVAIAAVNSKCGGNFKLRHYSIFVFLILKKINPFFSEFTHFKSMFHFYTP